jgi:pantothenate synthetase
VELFELDGVTVLAAAARIGATRLIDNIILEIPCQASAWLGRTEQ